MKKIVSAILVLVLSVGCNSTDDSNSSNKVKTHGIPVVQLNDSILKKTTLDKNKNLSSIEYENTNTHVITIYYYNEKGKIYQSLKFNTHNIKILENYVFYDNGKPAEKILKSKDNERLSVESFNSNGKTIRKDFYREGNKAINSFISFDENGKPDFSHHKSHFLNLTKSGNMLFVQPVGLQNKEFEHAYISVLDVYKKNSDDQFVEKQRLDFYSDSILRIDLMVLKASKKALCEVYVLTGKIDGTPNYAVYELYFENLDSIPKNNLYPILKYW